LIAITYSPAGVQLSPEGDDLPGWGCRNNEGWAQDIVRASVEDDGSNKPRGKAPGNKNERNTEMKANKMKCGWMLMAAAVLALSAQSSLAGDWGDTGAGVNQFLRNTATGVGDCAKDFRQGADDGWNNRRATDSGGCYNAGRDSHDFLRGVIRGH
jgi:hypothetical protein